MVIIGVRNKIENLIFLENGWTDFDEQEYVIGLNSRILEKNNRKVLNDFLFNNIQFLIKAGW